MLKETIHVDLTEFCQSFSGTLEPFAEALEDAIQTIRRVSDEPSLNAVSSALLDNQHRLKILRDKAAQQNTYLVIFGPLKSGKSTLMNAISGAYVSEVSSLPAYPCLVYVHEGEEREFSLTRFNGERKTFRSGEELQKNIEEAHELLAHEIRKADEEGRVFNPAQDYEDAVRRIDFTLSAPALRESGTILVDTPGLYTKMKYNYGQLTRDFRDTAACAVFVVKTDNLFFEQVFNEFADLLNVFSRVFLVVNIDSSKKDLSPSGELEPALESRDPRKIVEAFETLTVSAQIRSAIESGRLRIYLIDLLRTAERRLRESKEEGASLETETRGADEAEGHDAAAPEADTEEETDIAAGVESADHEDAVGPSSAGGDAVTGGEVVRPETEVQLGFDAFVDDLTEYLNSSDYIVEFMSDSLRQAKSVLDETEEQAESPPVADLRARIEDLKKASDEKENQLNAVRFLGEDKWDHPLEEMLGSLRERVKEQALSVLPGLKASLRGEVDSWYESDESLGNLLVGRSRSRIAEACAGARSKGAQLIDESAREKDAGLRLNSEILHCLRDLGLSLDDIYPAFEPEAKKRLADVPNLPDTGALEEGLPVRRTVLDWIMFRSPAAVRRRLLGESSPSDQPISAGLKAKRLGDAGRDYLAESIEQYAVEAFENSVVKDLESVLDAYAAFFKKHLAERLDRKASELQKVSSDLRRRYQAQRSALDALDGLGSATQRLRGEVNDLHVRFVGDKRSLDSDAEGVNDAENADDQDEDDEGEAWDSGLDLPDDGRIV
ncbi:MAG: dynamin family protein [Opitutales bacterium]|nr:dynamin family protein [Opitutales bacterium]